MVSLRGSYRNNAFVVDDVVDIPDGTDVIITILDEGLKEVLAKKSRQEAKGRLREAIKSVHEDSVRNGTDKVTMDEINAIIAECRAEMRAEQ